MRDFYVSYVEVVDGYPVLKQVKLADNQDGLRFFLKRLYYNTPSEQFDELRDIVDREHVLARVHREAIPSGQWTFDLGGDKVRIPMVKEGVI